MAGNEPFVADGFLNDAERERYARLQLAGGMPLPEERPKVEQYLQTADLTQPVFTQDQVQALIDEWKAARQGVPREETENPTWAGIKGIGEGFLNLIPFARAGVHAPTEMAPAPEAPLSSTYNFLSGLTGGVGEAVGGATVGALTGNPIGVAVGGGAGAAGGAALQIEEQQNIEVEREKQKILDEAAWWMDNPRIQAEQNQVQERPWDTGDYIETGVSGIMGAIPIGTTGALLKKASQNVAREAAQGVGEQALKTLARREAAKAAAYELPIDIGTGAIDQIVSAANAMNLDLSTPEGQQEMWQHMQSPEFLKEAGLETLINVIAPAATFKGDVRDVYHAATRGEPAPPRERRKLFGRKKDIMSDPTEDADAFLDTIPALPEPQEAVEFTPPVPPGEPVEVPSGQTIEAENRIKPKQQEGEADEVSVDQEQGREPEPAPVAEMPTEPEPAPVEPVVDEGASREVPDGVDVKAKQAEPEVVTDEQGKVKSVRGKKALYAHPGKTVESDPHEVSYVLREMDDVIASHSPDKGFQQNPKYPQQIQNRLYESNQSEQFKVQRNAAELSPSKLINENTGSDDAPPIIDSDGNVLAGNSRRMSLGVARERNPEKYAKYREYLRSNAEKFGLRAEDVDSMDAPILVREVDFSDDADMSKRTAFGSAANQSVNLRQTPSEMGATLATGERIPKDVKRNLLDSVEADQLSKALDDSRFVESFKKAMYADNLNEAASFFTQDGLKLNEQGKAVAKAMLYHDAIGDRDIANHIASGDASTRQSVENAIVQLSVLKNAPGQWKLGKPLRNALEAIAENPSAKTAQDVIDGTTSDFVNDINAPEPRKLTKKEKSLIRLIKDGKPTYLREVLKDYKEYSQAGDSMFGDNMSPGDALESLTNQKFKDKVARDSMRKPAVTGETDMIGADVFGTGTVGRAEESTKAPKSSKRKVDTSETAEVGDDAFQMRRTRTGDVYKYEASSGKVIETVVMPDKTRKGRYDVKLIRRGEDGKASGLKPLDKGLSKADAVERAKAYLAGVDGKIYEAAKKAGEGAAPAEKPTTKPKAKKAKKPVLPDEDFNVTERSDDPDNVRHVVRLAKIPDVDKRTLFAVQDQNGKWRVQDVQIKDAQPIVKVLEKGLTEEGAIARAKEILSGRLDDTPASKPKTKAKAKAKTRSKTAKKKTPGHAMRMLIPDAPDNLNTGDFNADVRRMDSKQTELPIRETLSVKELGMELKPLDAVSLYEMAGELLGRGMVKLKRGRELSTLERGVMGYVRKVRNKAESAIGLELGLRADLIKRGGAEIMRKVMAHEIGHVADYMPLMHKDPSRAFTTRRGNVVGHIYALNKFMRKAWGADKVTNAEYRKELIALTEWWNPYDKSKADAKYIKYRNSAVELYAEFTSVLLNNPAAAMERAPQTTRAFVKALKERPEVKAAYEGVLSDMRMTTSDLAAKRVQTIARGFAEGNKNMLAQLQAREDAKQARTAGFAETFVDMFSRVGGWTRKVQKAGKGEISDSLNAIEHIDRMLRDQSVWDVPKALRGSFDILGQAFDEGEMQKAWDYVGAKAFFDRVTGDRKDLFNPDNYTPPEAVKSLEGLREHLGEKKFKAVSDALEVLRDLSEETLLDGQQLGYYKDSVVDEWTKEGEHRKYAPFRVIANVKAVETPLFEHQQGTLSQVANPATMLALKLMATRSAIVKHKAMRSTIDLGTVLGEVRRLEEGQNARPEYAEITVRDNGEPVRYEIDPVVADAFKKYNKGLSPTQRKWFLPIIFLNKGQKAAYLTFSLPFAVRQVFRDAERTYSNLPKQAQKGWAKDAVRVFTNTMKSFPEAWAYTKDEYRSDVEWLIDNAVIEHRGNGLYVGSNKTAKDEVFHQLDLVAEKDPGKWARIMENKYIQPAIKILDTVVGTPARGIKRISEATEVLPKIAAKRILDESNLTDFEKSAYLRNQVGTPNYTRRGFATPITNTIAQFSNIQMQFLRSEVEHLKQLKGRRAVVAGRRILFSPATALSVSALYAAAEMGAFGDEVEEAYNKISEYDKSNYLCIVVPGQWQPTKDGRGRVPVYLRIPRDERARLIQGIFYKLFHSAQKGDDIPETVLDMAGSTMAYAYGQFPSATSNLQVLANLSDIVQGGTGFDAFRGQPIVTETERLAGRTGSEFWNYAFDQMGASSLYPVNAINTFVKNTPLQDKKRRAPLSEKIVDKVNERKEEQAKRSLASREVRAKYLDTGDKSIVEDAVQDGTITRRQADRIYDDAELTPDEQYLRNSGIPKKDWGEFLQ